MSQRTPSRKKPNRVHFKPSQLQHSPSSPTLGTATPSQPLSRYPHPAPISLPPDNHLASSLARLSRLFWKRLNFTFQKLKSRIITDTDESNNTQVESLVRKSCTVAAVLRLQETLEAVMRKWRVGEVVWGWSRLKGSKRGRGRQRAEVMAVGVRVITRVVRDRLREGFRGVVCAEDRARQLRHNNILTEKKMNDDHNVKRDIMLLKKQMWEQKKNDNYQLQDLKLRIERVEAEVFKPKREYCSDYKQVLLGKAGKCHACEKEARTTSKSKTVLKNKIDSKENREIEKYQRYGVDQTPTFYQKLLLEHGRLFTTITMFSSSSKSDFLADSDTHRSPKQYGRLF